MRITVQLYRIGFQLYRLVYPATHNLQQIRGSDLTLPWLFIGVELSNGDVIDKSDVAKYLLKNNIPITPEALDDSIYPYSVKRYFYLDATTLNEEEISPGGLVINDSKFK